MLAADLRRFRRIAEFESIDSETGPVVVRLRPLGERREVVIDPTRRFGNPVVRSTPPEVLAELVRAGEPIELVAQQYALTLEQILDPLEYERQQAS